MSNDTQSKISNTDMLRMTTDVVSAYVGNNSMPAAQIPEVIKTVYGSLASLHGATAAREAPRPAVPVRRSIMPDYIVCLEDGKKLNYAAQRSEFAKRIGLGRRSGSTQPGMAAAN